ncbi:hypothetical protein WK78_21970 [Burkholderia cepacia]|nr:hypothetical protein WK78_21970 [Burkholderia cepacia]
MIAIPASKMDQPTPPKAGTITKLDIPQALSFFANFPRSLQDINWTIPTPQKSHSLQPSALIIVILASLYWC